jgi:hypothetical protein
MKKNSFTSEGNPKNQYLIVLTPTINNFYISINDSQGKLLRTFNFSSVSINAGDHRKRAIFANEFGGHLGRYLIRLNLHQQATFSVKIKGADLRSFAFLKGLIKTGACFQVLNMQIASSHNGCRPSKRKRL